MESIAIMAAISIISTLFNAYASRQQQSREFEQQQQLLSQQQNFQSQREDLLFQRNSVPEQFQQMLDSGFNPILAASSIMGGNGTAAASSDTSPSAPTTNSAIGALSNMIGQGGQNLYDILRNNAEIQNIEADTSKKEVETGLLPRDYQLRMLSVTKQLEVWDASIERTKAAQHLDEEQTKLLQQQNIYYGRMAEAQIKAYQAQAADAYADSMLKLEQINTEEAKQRELNTQSGLNVANTELAHAETILVGTQNSTEYYRSESARIAQEFEKSLGDIPLTADARKYVQGLIRKGDIDGVNNFYQDIFATALNQQAGTEFGSMPKAGFPFGILGNVPLYGYNKGYQGNLPFWNPYSRR